MVCKPGGLGEDGTALHSGRKVRERGGLSPGHPVQDDRTVGDGRWEVSRKVRAGTVSLRIVGIEIVIKP